MINSTFHSPQDLSNTVPVSSPDPSEATVESLENCLVLAQDVGGHEQATKQFQQLRTNFAQDASQAQTMIDMLWWELLRARRSAQFWQKTCDVERELTERMAASHFQLQQNYLRLVQEQ